MVQQLSLLSWDNENFPTATILFYKFHSFIHQWLYSSLLGPGLFFSFVIFFIQTVGFLWWVINPSQCRYLHTGQYKHRIKAHTNIHALSGIRTHDPRARANEGSSCIIPRGHSDRRFIAYSVKNTLKTCIQRLIIGARNARRLCVHYMVITVYRHKPNVHTKLGNRLAELKAKR
jgi:hypothetical protein